jgi:hypothetical protein
MVCCHILSFFDLNQLIKLGQSLPITFDLLHEVQNKSNDGVEKCFETSFTLGIYVNDLFVYMANIFSFLTKMNQKLNRTVLSQLKILAQQTSTF